MDRDGQIDCVTLRHCEVASSSGDPQKFRSRAALRDDPAVSLNKSIMVWEGLDVAHGLTVPWGGTLQALQKIRARASSNTPDRDGGAVDIEDPVHQFLEPVSKRFRAAPLIFRHQREDILRKEQQRPGCLLLFPMEIVPPVYELIILVTADVCPLQENIPIVVKPFDPGVLENAGHGPHPFAKTVQDPSCSTWAPGVDPVLHHGQGRRRCHACIHRPDV